MDWTDSVTAQRIERRAYTAGWWWGFTSGLICGTCTTGLLVALVWTIARALECPQC